MFDEGIERVVTRYSLRGTAYTVREPLRMPRINDQFLDCVLYLYGSKVEAEAGENAGGSGFLLGMTTLKGGFLCAVTNRHVIDEGCCTIRLNTNDGRIDALEYSKRDWICSKSDDIAMLVLPSSIRNTVYRAAAISPDMLVSKQLVEQYNIGPGDEVLMTGRFVNVDGKQRNLPTARFGHIAQMPWEPIDGQESFLADIKSIGGFSGSPVFLEMNRFIARRGRGALLPKQYYLLGIDWAHIKNWVPVCGVDERPVSAGHQVEINTGIAAIVPAWKLLEHLEGPMLKKHLEEQPRFSSKAARDVSRGRRRAAPPSDDANPNAREDFTALLTAAVKKPVPKG